MGVLEILVFTLAPSMTWARSSPVSIPPGSTSSTRARPCSSADDPDPRLAGGAGDDLARAGGKVHDRGPQYTGFGKGLSATLALVAGLVLTPLGNYVLDWQAPFLPSVLGATIGFVLGRVLSASVPALAVLERRLTETRS